MATKRLGNDHMVWLETTTPGTYALIAGQRNARINRNASSIDLASKDDAGYAVSGMGLKTLDVSVEILPKLPDATGYTRLETLCVAYPQASFNIQIRKNGTAGVTGDAVFQAPVYGNLDSTSFDQNGGVPVAAKFVLAGQPVIDALL